jgi:hypothetical protein
MRTRMKEREKEKFLIKMWMDGIVDEITKA